MADSSMDKKDGVDVAPAQSHVHQEVAGMHDKALVTREPYGKPGMLISDLMSRKEKDKMAYAKTPQALQVSSRALM